MNFNGSAVRDFLMIGLTAAAFIYFGKMLTVTYHVPIASDFFAAL